MTAAARPQDHFCEEFERIQTSRGKSAPWLESVQFKSIAEFSSLGFPDHHTEEWKYTRLNRFIQQPFQIANCAPEILTEAKVKQIAAGYSGPRIVFEQGYLRTDLSSTENLPDGLIISTLAEAVKQGDPRVKALLNKSAQSLTQAFQALNLAMLQDGLFVQLASGVRLAEPLLVLCYQQSDSPTASYPRVLVNLGASSQMHMVEIHCGEGESANFSAGLTTLELGPAAALTYSKLQNESALSGHIGQLQISQQADSRCQLNLALFGGKICRQEVAIELVGQGAEYQLNATVQGQDRQHHDFHALIDHQAPNCSGETLWKGVVEDQSRAVFCGHIKVQAGADGTNAKLTTSSLLLSDAAEIDAKPVLEIYADDVKCAHGATIGQINQDQLFYLLSRGIGEKVARSLLLQAFTGEVTDRIPFAPLRDQVQALFSDRYQKEALE